MSAARRFAITTTLAAVTLAFASASPARAGERRAVPDVIDLPLPVAQAELRVAGFSSKAVAAADASMNGPSGTVARQEPSGFWWSDTSVEVVLYVCGLKSPVGPATSTPSGPSVPPVGPSVPPATSVPPSTLASAVPDVVGLTENEALELLKAWRVTIAPVDAVPGSEGRVVSQTPGLGAALAANGVVTLSVGRSGAPPAGAARIPNVVGLSSDDALAMLKAARLIPLLNVVASDQAGDGKVLSQEPSAGVIVARDSNVMVNVGKAPQTALSEAEVPDVRRLSELEARSRIAAAGLKATSRDRLADPSSANLVVDQDPAPGARLPRDSSVTIVVGRILLLPVAVPDVLGRDAVEAERILHDAGFAAERASALSLPSSAGRVVAQEPSSIQSAIRGSVIRITVGQTTASQSGRTATIPDVAGMVEAGATQRLQALGLTVVRRTVPGGPAEAGVVRGTQPASGTPLAPGAEVSLLVVEGGAQPSTTALPNYVGMDAAGAQSDLVARGLRGTVTYVTSVPEGRVIAQAPTAGSPVGPGATVTLTVSRAPTLGQPILIAPAQGASTPKNYGALFQWSAVPDAENYQFEIFKWKDDTWVVADNDIIRETQKRPSRVHAGTYQWHIRARRANGSVLIVGPWSEWRRLTIY
jgi:beta-lactam-binding protein with PASTA domain